MIDRIRIAELQEEIGAEDLALIAGIYFEEAAAMIASLDGDLDAEGRVRALHFLRSGALNIGFRGLAEGAASGDEGGAERLRAMLAQTSAEFAAARG